MAKDPDALLTPEAMTMSPSTLVPRSRRKRVMYITGQTPPGNARRIGARQQFSSRKRLNFYDVAGLQTRSQGVYERAPASREPIHSRPVAEESWSDEETKALLEFLLFHNGPGVVWFKRGSSKSFWVAAAKFIRDRVRTDSDCLRSGLV